MQTRASGGNAEGSGHLVQSKLGGVTMTRKITKLREKTRLDLIKERKWKEQSRRRAREAERGDKGQEGASPSVET